MTVIIAFIAGLATTAVVAWRIIQSLQRRYRQSKRDLLERARKAEKKAELATLVNSLAHEIRNPLSIIKVNLQLLGEDVQDFVKAAKSDDAADYNGIVDPEQKFRRQLRKIETVKGEADRLNETLNDFMKYAGKIELQSLRQNINEVLDDLIDFYEPQAIAENVHIRHVFDAEEIFCRIDISLIKQALLNLFMNAVQVMDGDGELMIRTFTRDDYACIEIIDTGPGIDIETQGRVFEPYFTTRSGGTGLGLPTCRRIIEEHGGRIELFSEPGKGTRFTIELPSVQ